MKLDHKKIEALLNQEFTTVNIMSKELCFHVAKFLSQHLEEMVDVDG